MQHRVAVNSGGYEMKKCGLRVVAVVLLAVFAFSFVACGDDKNICIMDQQTEKQGCYTFLQYGLFDDDKKNPNVEYKVVAGNVVWGIILVETIVAPIILFGWYMYEPVGPKMPIGSGAIPGTER